MLLDNKFATLPYVVGEGRRVIGNIERVSNLFLTKTVYSVLLAVLVGLAGLASKIFGTDPLLFPFQPIHVTIAAWFTIGIPAFILSLAPNNERAHPGFVRRVMTSALPSGLVVGVATFISYLMAYQGRAADGTGADPGLDGGADHVADERGVGAGGGGAAVRVVAGGAGRGLRSGVRGDLLHPASAARQFMLDPSNVALTSMALGIGVVGAAVIEVLWWVQGAVTR